MKIFHQLLSINEAINEIEKRYGKLKPLGEETVSLKESLGRIISREIFASIDSPPFDRSEVDGYAVNHLDLIGADESNPIKLRILGKSSVGVMPQFYLIKNTCAEISTGAPIPKGATAVVMVEYTKSDGQYVTFFRSVAPGENIAQAGSDVMVGDTTLRSGTRISSREIAILASLGINEINVFKRLNVGIISTGDEIVSPGEILTSGKIFDTNQYSIGARLNEIGAIPKYYGIVKDDYSLIKEKILKAISENDIVITSGSTSAGMGDLIYSVIDDIGELIVHGLKIKPGKPTTVGISNGKLIFGLPGFPFSAIVAYEFFVKKILLKLSGFMGEEEKFIGKMAMRLNSSKNVEEFFPVSIISNKNGYSIYPLFGNSGSITTLLYADGIIRIPEDTNFIDDNESIEVIPISSSIKLPKLTVIGSHCPLLEELVGNDGIKYIKVGSTAGWNSIKRGEADIAGTHLFDDETGEYNIPFIDKFGLRGKAFVIRGYGREQGIIVKKGNPKNIKGIEDFLRDDITIINRVKGSGTRALLDFYLKNIAKKENLAFDSVIGKIKGYAYEGKTHSSVASAVAQGRADAGVGLKYYSYLYQLDFIPLGLEIFDIVVNKNSENNTYVLKLIETLRSKDLEGTMKKFVGYKVLEDSGKIYGK